MAHTTASLRGTSFVDFQVGKRGPRIRKGTENPNDLIFVDTREGDLYLRFDQGETDDGGAMYRLQGTCWIECGPNFAFQQVPLGAKVVVHENHQMLVNGSVEIEGQLNIDGQLVVEL